MEYYTVEIAKYESAERRYLFIQSLLTAEYGSKYNFKLYM